MISVRGISEVLAGKLAEVVGEPQKTPIFSYALEMLIGEPLKLLCLIMIGYLTGLLVPMVTVMAAAIPLRVITGSGHCTSNRRCLVASVLMFVPMAFAGKILAVSLEFNYLLAVYLIASIIMAVIVDRYGPGYSINYPETTPERVQQVKRNANIMLVIYLIVLLVMFYFMGNSAQAAVLASASIGIMWQALMVTPLGHRFINLLDKTLAGLKI